MEISRNKFCWNISEQYMGVKEGVETNPDNLKMI